MSSVNETTTKEEELPGPPWMMAFVRSMIISSLTWSVLNLAAIIVFGITAIWLPWESQTYKDIKNCVLVWLCGGWLLTYLTVGVVIFFRAKKYYRCEQVRIAMARGFRS